MRKRSGELDPDEVRMSLGDHLDELRGCLGRSLLALLVACLVCIWPAKYLLGLVARPVVLALRRHGQPDNLLATSPTETLLIYIKIVIFAGIVLASPYILYQLWSFVAAGLYRHERRWVGKLVPVSVGLFLAGATFMYTLVLLLSLNFLVGFSSWIPLPDPTPNSIERVQLHQPEKHATTSRPAGAGVPSAEIVDSDPEHPQPGQVWFNQSQNRLKFQGEDGVYSTQLMRDEARGLVTTHFKIGDYLNFVLIMTLAFGVAFQLPLVVVFLAGSGIVPVKTMRKARKIVILIIVCIAGVLAPPDFFSHLMLSIPMVLLFELGLWIAARREARQPAAASEE